MSWLLAFYQSSSTISHSAWQSLSLQPKQREMPTAPGRGREPLRVSQEGGQGEERSPGSGATNSVCSHSHSSTASPPNSRSQGGGQRGHTPTSKEPKKSEGRPELNRPPWRKQARHRRGQKVTDSKSYTQSYYRGPSSSTPTSPRKLKISSHITNLYPDVRSSIICTIPKVEPI